MAKLQIDESNLVAIGDALRVHFGATEKEGTREFITTSPMTIDTGGWIIKQGTEEKWVVDNVTATAIDPDAIPPRIPYAKFYNPYYARTFYIPEADHIIVDMTYYTDQWGSEKYNDYVWISPGRYSDINKNTGVKWIHNELDDSGNPDKYWWHCSKCGYKFSGHGPFHPLQSTFEILHPTCYDAVLCPNCWPLDEYPAHVSSATATPKYNIWERNKIAIAGNEVTISYMSFNTTDYLNTHGGYYCDIYPYDADGNLLTSYEVIMDEVPNDYTLAEMPTAISKLNSYPNGEEEHF